MVGGTRYCWRKKPMVNAGGLGGFTMIELLVTISVVAILLAIALPSFTSLMNSNRLSAQANEVVAAMQLARVEAVRQNKRAIVCGSANGSTCSGSTAWNSGWITFLDMDGNGTPTAAEIIRADTVKAPLVVRSILTNVSFRSDGMAHLANGNLADNTVTVCIPTTSPAQNRRVISLALGSRISTAPANGAGVCP